MPMPLVIAVFHVNNLEKTLFRVIFAQIFCKNNDLTLLAEKIRLFQHLGNYQSEKLERDAALDRDKKTSRNAAERTGVAVCNPVRPGQLSQKIDYNLIPLDLSLIHI